MVSTGKKDSNSSYSLDTLIRDEGFHLALVGAWDNDLSLEILESWMNLVDESGWIAREQILGEEPRSKVSTLMERWSS